MLSAVFLPCALCRPLVITPSASLIVDKHQVVLRRKEDGGLQFIV